MYWSGGSQIMIMFDETTHLLPPKFWVFLQKRKGHHDYKTKNSNFLELTSKDSNLYRLRNMRGRRKRCESGSCKEWKQKPQIWDILEQGRFTGFMEKLKGRNLTITKQFIKTWKNGSILVGNQRMEVIEDIIAKATSLEARKLLFFIEMRKSLIKLWASLQRQTRREIGWSKLVTLTSTHILFLDPGGFLCLFLLSI